jgi:hypothetical protein
MRMLGMTEQEQVVCEICHTPHLLLVHRLGENKRKITIKNRLAGRRIQCRPTLALNQAHFLCPGGTTDNSPAFQRRERRKSFAKSRRDD